LLNQLLIFDFGLGIAGSGWATDLAQRLGSPRRQYCSWEDHARALPLPSHRAVARTGAAGTIQIGISMGLLIAADILGFALFQLMQVRLGTVDGASTKSS
jgi:Na+-driven multidrug efflux pump